MTNNTNTTKEGARIPWFISIASLFILIVVGLFLWTNINWFKESVFDQNILQRNDSTYRIYAYQMFLSLIKRSVALFSGFGIMFLGMSVVFYTTKEKIAGNVQNNTLTASLVTNSPGIIAILLGGYLIISTMQSKDKFPGYEATTTTDTTTAVELDNPPLPRSK